MAPEIQEQGAFRSIREDQSSYGKILEKVAQRTGSLEICHVVDERWSTHWSRITDVTFYDDINMDTLRGFGHSFISEIKGSVNTKAKLGSRMVLERMVGLTRITPQRD